MTRPFQDSLGFCALCSCGISSVLVCSTFRAFSSQNLRGANTNSSEVHSWGKAAISDIFKYLLGLDLKYTAVKCEKFRSHSLAGRMLVRIPSLGSGCSPTNQAGLSTLLCSSTTLSQVSWPEGSNPPLCKPKQVGKTGHNVPSAVPPERGVKTRAAVIVPL